MNPLGRTGIMVSHICLGTMTFGRQTEEADAFDQLDMAWERGVNFLDTAEMYPFPSTEETFGGTEEVVGNWMKARGNRSDVVVATKIVGPGPRFDHVRGGGVKYNRRHVEEAVDASLKRLGTDYIDLYQTHWPERPANYFGKLGYRHDADAEWTPFEEVLEAIDGVVKAGKVRAFGASNETAWGVVAQLRIADDKGLPRVSAVQNPYGLLNRAYEVGLAEVSIREDCGLLAYSPLGFGALTGKHLDGATKPSSRQALFPEFQRYFNARAEAATRKYVDLAVESGLDPAVMALAFINMQPFLTANIVGARTTDQLAANLASADLVLPPDVLTAIEAIHAEHTYPSP